MTYEELQYAFETQEPKDLMRLPTELVMAYGNHMIQRIPAHRWQPRDWATSCGIMDQFRRTQDISAKQKMFVIAACHRTLPQGLLYL